MAASFLGKLGTRREDGQHTQPGSLTSSRYSPIDLYVKICSLLYSRVAKNTHHGGAAEPIELDLSRARGTLMTLILGLYVKWHAIQVSDRLVSLNTIPPSPFDPLANKTVIYFGRRGIVAISAAGLGYLNGKTTDTWIAETLSGVDLSIQSALAMGRSISYPFDIGQALERLRQRVSATYAHESPASRKVVVDLQVIGSQWDRRHQRLRPVICKITNTRTKTAQFEKLVTPRYWDVQNGWYTIGSGIGYAEARDYMRHAFQASGGLISPEHCIDVMVNAIRYVAASHPDVVGQDCMCVHIQGSSPMVSVSFRPKTRYQISTASGPIPGPVAFTPYVIARDMVAVPSISLNNMILATPGVDIQFDGGGLVPPEAAAAFQRSLTRPAPPEARQPKRR